MPKENQKNHSKSKPRPAQARHPVKTEAKRKWYLLDAQDQKLGRLACAIAVRLLGKNLVTYNHYQDQGGFVVVINLKKMFWDPQRAAQKFYYHHTKHAGGLKAESAAMVFKNDPAEVLRRAVCNMIPRNSLRSARLRRLKIYLDAKHPHPEAQPVK